MKLITLFFIAALGALSCECSAQTVQTSRPDRTVIPLAEPGFEGTIGETYKDSTAAWPKLPAPPAGAPNVVLIMLEAHGPSTAQSWGPRKCLAQW